MPGPRHIPVERPGRGRSVAGHLRHPATKLLRGPGYVNVDMAFSKTTAITERVKMEFRAEFFNIFNHANFLNPGVVNNGDGVTFNGGARQQHQ